MKITKIKINKIKGDKGLVGFAEIVLNDSFFVGGIGIFSRLDEPERIRLVFPTKKRGGLEGQNIKMCYPMTNTLYKFMESEIQEEYDRS